MLLSSLEGTQLREQEWSVPAREDGDKENYPREQQSASQSRVCYPAALHDKSHTKCWRHIHFWSVGSFKSYSCKLKLKFIFLNCFGYIYCKKINIPRHNVKPVFLLAKCSQSKLLYQRLFKTQVLKTSKNQEFPKTMSSEQISKLHRIIFSYCSYQSTEYINSKRLQYLFICGASFFLNKYKPSDKHRP